MPPTAISLEPPGRPVRWLSVPGGCRVEAITLSPMSEADYKAFLDDLAAGSVGLSALAREALGGGAGAGT